MNSIRNFFFLKKKTPASIAKNRLHIIITERKTQNDLTSYCLPKLKKDLLKIIYKHIDKSKEISIQSKKKNENNLMLEINIIITDKKYKN